MNKVLSGSQDTVLIFLDGVHFVLGQDQVCSSYSRERRFTLTYSGRKRHSILGAINFADCKMTKVSTNGTLNALDVISLLLDLHQKYKGKTIHVVLDNAQYQHAKSVEKLANYFDINLVFIPPYSPNLNLIERMWKFTKANLRKRLILDFEELVEAIHELLEDFGGKLYEQVRHIMSDKVQLFDKTAELSARRISSVPQKIAA